MVAQPRFLLREAGHRPSIRLKSTRPVRRSAYARCGLNSIPQEVYSIRDETTVHDAARYLRDHQVRSVGVLDAAGKLAGVISQSDISDKVAAENKCPAWMRVSEIMSRDLLVVQPEFPLEECLRLMEKHGVFHLLVAEESGRFLRHDLGRGPAASHRFRSQSPRRHV